MRRGSVSIDGGSAIDVTTMRSAKVVRVEHGGGAMGIEFPEPITYSYDVWGRLENGQHVVLVSDIDSRELAEHIAHQLTGYYGLAE